MGYGAWLGGVQNNEKSRYVINVWLQSYFEPIICILEKIGVAKNMLFGATLDVILTGFLTCCGFVGRWKIWLFEVAGFCFSLVSLKVELNIMYNLFFITTLANKFYSLYSFQSLWARPQARMGSASGLMSCLWIDNLFLFLLTDYPSFITMSRHLKLFISVNEVLFTVQNQSTVTQIVLRLNSNLPFGKSVLYMSKSWPCPSPYCIFNSWGTISRAMSLAAKTKHDYRSKQPIQNIVLYK